MATANPAKLREFRALLEDLPFELTSLAELGIESPEESGATFIDNALIKARHAALRAAELLRCAGAAGSGSRMAGCAGVEAEVDLEPRVGVEARVDVAAIADDSGLEVDALGGAPGIFSARYAGPGADDAANNMKLMRALEGIPVSRRGARYRCALVLVTSAEDPAPLVAEGVWEGTLLDAPRGSSGFGYDPYFWIPSLGVTAAELEPERKNRLSHRGLALRSLRGQLERRSRA